MKKTLINPIVKYKLRKQAEKRLEEESRARPDQSADANNKLLHELQVYQIELEMQNAELLGAQSQAAEALERYTLLYDFAPVGYLTLNQDGLVKEINQTGAVLLGVAKDMIVGHSLVPFVHDQKLFREHLKEVSRKSVNVIIELQIRHIDDKLLDVQMESRIIERGKGIGSEIHTIMTDISDRKALERELQQQLVEMENLCRSQVAAQTASAIAHDLNQPLHAISAYSEVAVHYLNGNAVNTDQLRRALLGCVDQAQRAGQRLHELLNFLHKGDLIFESIDVNDLVQEGLVIARNEGVVGFEPVLDLDHTLRPVFCNQLQVKKVLVNLLRNSVEAMRDAGQSDACIIKVRTLSECNMAQVTVHDNGPGLDAEIAKHIFEPFFTTKPINMGLGLAISRSLIEINGGQLWLESGTYSGTVFHFSLPFAP